MPIAVQPTQIVYLTYQLLVLLTVHPVLVLTVPFVGLEAVMIVLQTVLPVAVVMQTVFETVLPFELSPQGKLLTVPTHALVSLHYPFEKPCVVPPFGP